MTLGLVNKEKVTSQAGEDQLVLLSTRRTEKQSKPAGLLNKSVVKKEFNPIASQVLNF